MNKLLLEATIQRLFSEKTRNDLMTKTWSLCDYSDTETKFCIHISMIKGKQIWFQTWIQNDQRERINIKSHTCLDTDSRTIVAKLLESNPEIIEASLFNFSIEKMKSHKIESKQEIQEKTNPIRRRKTENVIRTVDTLNHLVDAQTDSEKRQAKLERTIFKDPKMWKFK